MIGVTVLIAGFVTPITAALMTACHICLVKVMHKHKWSKAMTTATNVAVTSEPTRKTSRELTENELAHVSGGIIAVLVGLAGTYNTALGSPEELQLRK